MGIIADDWARSRLTTLTDKRHLRGDVIAGLTVTGYLVPQVMAYSALAGVGPQVGLWVAVATLTVYFLVGSSRLLSAGPESTTALLTAATLAPLAAGDGGRYAALALVLAGLVGAIALLAWLLRLGFLGDLLSKPVLVGYMAGVAVIMVISQLGKLTGVDVAGNSVFEDANSFARNAVRDGLSWPTVAMGLGVAVLLLVLTPRFPRFPVPIAITVLAAVATWAFDLGRFGIATVGAVATGPPSWAFDRLALADVRALAVPALGIAFVAFTDNLLTARMLARGEPVKANQELLALGATNVTAAGVGGYPVSSSASRAVIGLASGARTQRYSLIAAAATLVIVLIVPGVLASFPTACLAGLVTYAAIRLVDLHEFRRLWAFRKREFALAVAATVSVLAFDILVGILAAIALSVIDLLIRVARPHAAVLGQAPGVAGWHDVDDYPGAAQIPGLLVFRYDSPLFFADAQDFEDRCLEAVRAARPRWLLLNMEAIVEVDITGLDALEQVRRTCSEEGVVLALVRVKKFIVDDLMRHGVGERIGLDRIYPTLPTAVEAYEAWAADQP